MLDAERVGSDLGVGGDAGRRSSATRCTGGEQAGDLGTQAPIGEAGHGVDGDAQSADQGHRARIPEAQGSGSLALLKRGQCDPLKERGRNGTALAGTLNSKQTTIGGASLGLQFR